MHICRKSNNTVNPISVLNTFHGGISMLPGRDYIGVGVGAMVFNQEGKVFLAQRGPRATNEIGKWEFPGGKIRFGEKIYDAIKREFFEEYGMEIEIIELLCVTDHI